MRIYFCLIIYALTYLYVFPKTLRSSSSCRLTIISFKRPLLNRAWLLARFLSNYYEIDTIIYILMYTQNHRIIVTTRWTFFCQHQIEGKPPSLTSSYMKTYHSYCRLEGLCKRLFLFSVAITCILALCIIQGRPLFERSYHLYSQPKYFVS